MRSGKHFKCSKEDMGYAVMLEPRESLRTIMHVQGEKLSVLGSVANRKGLSGLSRFILRTLRRMETRLRSAERFLLPDLRRASAYSVDTKTFFRSKNRSFLRETDWNRLYNFLADEGTPWKLVVINMTIACASIALFGSLAFVLIHEFA
jgi:hypothetical protein